MGDRFDLKWDHSQARTLSDRLTFAIRDAVMSGELSPGQPLRLAELARRFKVSQSPLREALRQLEAEGFVRLAARHHAIVSPLDPGELRDFADIASVLEGIAVRDAVAKMTPAVLAAAERVYAKLHDEPDPDRVAVLMLRLALTLYAPSGRYRLLAIVRLVRLNAHRYSRSLSATPEGREITVAIGRGLIDVCRRGDPEAAGQFIEESYHRAGDMLLGDMTTPQSGLPASPRPARARPPRTHAAKARAGATKARAGAVKARVKRAAGARRQRRAMAVRGPARKK